MGFLKFLSRNKEKELDFDLNNTQEFDMPPPPPPIGSEEEFQEDKLPEFPELPKMPDMPEEESLEMKEGMNDIVQEPENLPDFPPMNQDFGKTPSMPPVERFPRREMPVREPFMQQPRPLFGMQRRPLFNPTERFEKNAVKEERCVLNLKGSKGPIYVRIERFRGILSDTGIIRNNLKMADEVIVKLNEIDENRNRVFDKWHNAMNDMQKKFVFIDKTLFKR